MTQWSNRPKCDDLFNLLLKYILHASYLRHSQKYTFQVSSPKAKAIICIYNVGNVLSDIFDIRNCKIVTIPESLPKTGKAWSIMDAEVSFLTLTRLVMEAVHYSFAFPMHYSSFLRVRGILIASFCWHVNCKKSSNYLLNFCRLRWPDKSTFLSMCYSTNSLVLNEWIHQEIEVLFFSSLEEIFRMSRLDHW